MRATDLTEEQWRAVLSIISDYERINMLDKAVDASPAEFDADGGKVWHVWCEGYAATGEHGTAHFVGKKWAKTFDRACELLHKERGSKAMGDFTHETENSPPRYWGCRLYDNEYDARKSYG